MQNLSLVHTVHNVYSTYEIREIILLMYVYIALLLVYIIYAEAACHHDIKSRCTTISIMDACATDDCAIHSVILLNTIALDSRAENCYINRSCSSRRYNLRAKAAASLRHGETHTVYLDKANDMLCTFF